MTNVKAIIKYKKEIMAEDEIIKSGVSIERTLHSINAVVVTIPQEEIDELKKNSNIEYVETTTPNDVHILGFKGPLSTESLSKTLQSSQQIPWGITKIRADVVQRNENKGDGINVCILDTGIDYNHEDLKGQMKLGYNFVSKTNDPYDDFGHGTWVAGCVAAIDNDIGIIGVAPECSLIIGKVLDNTGSGSYDNIVAGIQWAINNKAQVISMSFGGSSFSQALSDMCDSAKKSGIVLVASAGNSNGDGSTDTVGYPAKLGSVIAVAATDISDNRASFSSAGDEVWVSAPGVNCLSTVPKGSCQLCDPTGYKFLSGTSMSCPYVSGTVALMLKSKSNISPDDIRSVIGTTSVHLGLPGKNVFYGNGRIDAANAAGKNPPPPPHPVLANILIPSSTEIIVGQTNSLSVTCKDTNGNTMTCPSLVWTSDNTGIVTVDNNGIIKGINAGTANITASSGSIVSNKCSVTVTASPPPSRSKYNVQQIGNAGVIVTKTMIGGVDADTACQQTCDILKEIDNA